MHLKCTRAWLFLARFPIDLVRNLLDGLRVSGLVAEVGHNLVDQIPAIAPYARTFRTGLRRRFSRMYHGMDIVEEPEVAPAQSLLQLRTIGPGNPPATAPVSRRPVLEANRTEPQPIEATRSRFCRLCGSSSRNTRAIRGGDTPPIPDLQVIDECRHPFSRRGVRLTSAPPSR